MTAGGVYIPKEQSSIPPGSTNFASIRRGKNLLNHSMPLKKISHSKWIYKYLNPERRHPRSFRMLRACNDDFAKSEKLNLDVE